MPSPCPFCNAELKPVAKGAGDGNTGYGHPTNGCMLSGNFFGMYFMQKWEQRDGPVHGLQPPKTTAAAGLNLFMEIVDEHPKFNDTGQGQKIGVDMLNTIIKYYRETPM